MAGYAPNKETGSSFGKLTAPHLLWYPAHGPHGGLPDRVYDENFPLSHRLPITAADATCLRSEIASCRVCAPFLSHEPRPVVQFGPRARIVIISQAPGRSVHDSGVPWHDASGARLREWTGLLPEVFYDPDIVALVPMGLCYPGRGAGADLPPRPECAPLWHGRILSSLTSRRLTLLVGHYAQTHTLPQNRRLSVTERVRAFDTLAPDILPLPHPSWRATGWMQRNPWFAAEILPRLRRRVADTLALR